MRGLPLVLLIGGAALGAIDLASSLRRTPRAIGWRKHAARWVSVAGPKALAKAIAQR